MQLTESKIFSILRQNHFKLTPQRRAILNIIYRSKDHLTPSDIHRKVSMDYPGIGLVTVYRTLKLLVELDLICELHTGDNCPSYTARTPQHHHHLVCSGCGKVVDFTSPRLIEHNVAELEGRLSRESGFRIDDHLLEFTGLCELCQKAQASSV